MQVGYKLEPGAKAPETAYDSPGIDLFAVNAKYTDSWYPRIAPNEVALISLGVSFEIPAGHIGILKDRSSSASKGYCTLGGVIDPDYRGVVKAQVHNISEEDIYIEHGQKLVQMLVLPAPHPSLVPMEDLAETSRGTNGFGSSDTHAA